MPRLTALGWSCALAAALLLASGPAHAQGWPLIVSSTCPPASAGGDKQTRQQTGFALAGMDGVITALHGVTACVYPHIVVTDASGNKAIAQVARVNLGSDVALLELEQPHSLVVRAYERGQVSGASARVVGFPHGVPSALSTRLRLRDTRPVGLGTLIPTGDGLTRLSTRQSPSTRSMVLSIEGHLTVGHSGAPILGAGGQVIGIANGGLEKGSTEIGWGIPVAELDRLEAFGSLSWEQRLRLAMTADLLFAHKPSSLHGLPATVQCAGRKLTLIRGVLMTSLMEHVDDPETYRYLIFRFGLHGQQHELGVYRNLERTRDEVRMPITMVVPVGWSLRSTSKGCVATPPGGSGFSIQFSFFPVERRRSRHRELRHIIDEMFLRFEHDMFCREGYVVDQTMSNPGGRILADRGIVARRKSYMWIEHRCGWPMMHPTAWEQPGWWHEPIRDAPEGPYQCGVPMCPVVPPQGQTIAYPEAWGYPPPPVDVRTYGTGFMSAVASESLMLVAAMKLHSPQVFKAYAECAMSLSQADECDRTYALQRAWAVGILAATASTLME